MTKDWTRVVLAYEPVWAAESNKPMKADAADETCRFIRGWIAENVSDDVAAVIKILYAGNVSPKAAPDYVTKSDIDGLVASSNSFKPEFRELVENCN